MSRADVPSCNVYVSEWGIYKIPDDLFARTKLEKCLVESWTDGEKQKVFRPAVIPENWPFFKWLHDQEVASGKPAAEI